MTLVIDASAVAAALVNRAPEGPWALSLLREGLIAPHLMPVEVTNMLRRSVLAGDASADSASLAVADLLDLRVQYLPFEPFADRIWELRPTLTSYDAWYVAIAEALDVPLATADLHLARAPGTRCKFTTPG